MDEVFKAIKDPTRRKILQLLKAGNLTAGEIAEAFDISKPSISHHLDLLKRGGLVTVERQGQFLHYRLNTTVVEDLLRWVVDLGSAPSVTAVPPSLSPAKSSDHE